MTQRNEFEPLSSQGALRRDLMRDQLARELIRVRRARRVRNQSVLAASILMMVGALAWVIVGGQPQGAVAPSPIGGGVGSSSPVDSMAGETIQVAWLTTRIDPDSVAMNDDELLAELAAMGRPTGLIRLDGRTLLTSEVTDDRQLQDEQEPTSLAPSRAIAIIATR